MNAGDLWVAIHPELKDFVSELAKGSEAAGDAAGKTAAGSFGRAFRVASALVATGLVAAALGGEQLAAAAGRYRAETGASIEESRRWSEEINDLAAHNVQSLEQIAGASTKVRTDLGLTGDAQRVATQEILDFARATKTDATEAVLAFDDALDAWKLTAASLPGIMDQLVASQQRYGGSIVERLEALRKLGLAQATLNLSERQAIALLNLWATQGVDVTRMVRGINEATGEVAPALQEAVDQARASLGDYEVDLAGAAGATKRAADDMNSDFRSKVAAGINAARAAIRGLGEEFGPTGSVILAIATAAPAIGKVLGAIGIGHGAIYGAAVATGANLVAGLQLIWGAAMAAPGVLGKISAAGTAAGQLYGAQFTKALPLLLGGGGAVGVDLGMLSEARQNFNDYLLERQAAGRIGSTIHFTLPKTWGPEVEKQGQDDGGLYADSFVKYSQPKIIQGLTDTLNQWERIYKDAGVEAQFIPFDQNTAADMAQRLKDSGVLEAFRAIWGDAGGKDGTAYAKSFSEATERELTQHGLSARARGEAQKLARGQSLAWTLVGTSPGIPPG